MDGGNPPARGRPRSREIDEAVIRATSEQLDDGGFASLSLESVARRAGTTRAAIYRRWPTRAHLALDAVAQRLTVPAAPDTGCTLCDVGEALQLFLTAFRTLRPEVLSSLHAECVLDAELANAYRRTIDEPPRRAVSAMLERARERGDLRPDVEVDHLLDILNAVIYHRVILGRDHLSDSELGALVETLLRGAATDYAALVERSRALEIEHAVQPNPEA